MTDGAGNHGNNEHCEVIVQEDLLLTATYYHVETCCDYLTIGGTKYLGDASAPSGLALPKGTRIVWRSDYSITSGGFQFCGELDDAPRSPPPTPPPTPAK